MILNNSLILAVYDGDSFQLSCYIERPIFIEYLPSYNSGGTFKIVAQVTDQNSQCIKKNSLIHIESNVVGVVSYIQLSSELTMTIGGSLGDSLLSQRWLFELLSITNSSPGQIIQSVYNELTAIPYTSFVDYSSYTGDPIDIDVEPISFLDFIQDICQKYELGYRIVVNTTNPLTLNLEIYQGTDKSDTVVMSQNYESIADFDYTLSAQDLVNYVKVIGQNDVEVEVTTTPTPTGINLCEYYLDCTGIDQGSMTQSEYEETLSKKGQEIIDRYHTKETYSGNYTGLTFKLGIDYFLGDIVSAKDKKFDIDTTQRIIEIIKQFDSSGIYIQLKFGEIQNNISAVTNSLKKRVDKLENHENESSGSTSYGVGEDIGNHSERFNDYTHNTASGSHEYLHIEGSYNTAAGGYYTFIGGYNNNFASGYASIISGWSNAVAYAYCALILGDTNTVTNANKGAVFGYKNTVNTQNSVVCGEENTLSSGSDDDIVCGSHNTVSGDYNVVAGHGNTVPAHYSLIGGQGNNISGSWNVVAGRNITASNVYDSLLIGRGHTITATVNDIIVCGVYASVSNNDYFVIGNGSSNSPSNCFRVNNQGKVYASEYNTSGADYAEYFEWYDGNHDNEDRRGLLVQLVGDKIIPACSSEVIGAVTSKASVVGNAYEEEWHGKYRRDSYGDYILINGKRQVSYTFDSNRSYIPRSQRPEWATIGLVGRLIVRDKGTCMPGSYIFAKDGIAYPTFNETRIRCLQRIDGSHIEVMIR